MLATYTVIEIMNEADELGKMITESEPFYQYIETKKALANDEDAQRRIRRFTDVKAKYEEVMRFGKYHPDYKSISTEIRKVKREVDSSPSVIAYKKAEKELETLLNEVSEIIARSVSDKIKVPTGNPYFDQLACGGGCSSGGTCQCRQ